MPRATYLLIAALMCLTSLAAQQKKPPQVPKPVEHEDVVRVSTELVQTDVMVFDKDGKFVSGLRPEQFELLIDGQPQPITFFESVVTGGRNEAGVLRAASGGKPSQPLVEESGEPISERGRTILFFVNDLHLDTGSLARVHKTIKYFIDHQLGPKDQVAITSASGQIGFLQQLTDNPTVLRAALDRINYVPGTVRDGERPQMSDYAAFLLVERKDRQLFDYFVRQTMGAQNVPEPLAASIVERRSNFIIRQSDITVKTALSSLVNLMGVTAKLPGRKLVFFLSDGFVPNFTGSDFTAVMRRATDAANRSGVVIYSLDARGLTTDSWLNAEQGGGDPSGVLQSRMTGERSFTQEPLHALAADTGGRAVLNSNALEDGIGRALAETSRYYLLAWRPANEAQRSSNFSKIKINIPSRPDLKVQLRRGYLGSPVEQPKAKAQPTTVQVDSTAVLGVTESSTEEIRAALSLGYKQGQGGGLQLTSSVQVNAQATEGGGGGKLDVSVLGAVFDSRGKAVGSFKQRVEVTRTRAQEAPVYTYVNHQVEVPPGIYQVRTIAYERGTTRLTNTMEWIEIPKLKAGTFSISSLYVGEIGEAGGGAPVGVNASGRFGRNSRLRFTTYIYNAATPPQLGVQIKILRGAQALITPPEIRISTEKLGNLANVPYTGEFPLSTLPAGNYVLEVTVNDQTAKASASQQLRFSVY